MTPTRTRRTAALAALAGLLATTAACTIVAPPDQIGLYYNQGSVEGNKFGHCVLPGTTGEEPINDYVVWLPDNVRYWRYALDDKADVKDGIVAGSLPTKGSTSGSQVKVFSQTSMMVNTNCTDGGSPAVQYWERVGRRFGAGWTGDGSLDEANNLRGDDGWREMMLAIVDVSLQTAIRQVARKYEAASMINNTDNVQARMQAEIGSIFISELNRLAGGRDYFCGPTFIRGADATWKETSTEGASTDKHGPCPPVEVTITNITRASAAEQSATEEKAAATERAAAALIGAQSLVDVRNKLGAALADPAYVRYLIEQERTRQVEICAAKPGCIVRIGPGVDADTTTG